MKKTRPYVLQARAQAVLETRERIMEATLAMATEKPLSALVLPDIAARSGVSVQTVLRQFGSRDGLLDAAGGLASDRVRNERQVVPGDIPAAITTLFDHYEARGDGILLLLGQEGWEPRAAKITAQGRAIHQDWVEQAFAPLVAPARGPDRGQTLDLLVVATDVYTWKLLRRDRKLDRKQAEAHMLRLVSAILAGI
ncbi:MAG: TetR/AcrR family transcriptional regulator [Actinomycetes bacterium]